MRRGHICERQDKSWIVVTCRCRQSRRRRERRQGGGTRQPAVCLCKARRLAAQPISAPHFKADYKCCRNPSLLIKQRINKYTTGLPKQVVGNNADCIFDSGENTTKSRQRKQAPTEEALTYVKRINRVRKRSLPHKHALGLVGLRRRRCRSQLGA
jgi:hypothetical protein